MPPKRQTRKKNKLINKQDKYNEFLMTRLTEINLRVQDHVYEDVLIGSDEAQKYVEELTSLDLNKCTDERILQVSEKLLRCMKRVIIENSETVEVSNQNVEIGITFANEKNNCNQLISPTYSIENESKTISDEVVNTDITLDVYNTDFQKYEDIGNYELDSNILDANIDLHRALSNLSITEVEKVTADECSQSILKDLNNENLAADECSQSILTDLNTRKLAADDFSQNILTDLNTGKLASDNFSQNILTHLNTEKLAADGFSQNILMDYDIEISKLNEQSDNIQDMSFTDNCKGGIFKKPKEMESKKVNFNVLNPVFKPKYVNTLTKQENNKSENVIEKLCNKTKRKPNKRQNKENKRTEIKNKKPRKEMKSNTVTLETNKLCLKQTHKKTDSQTNTINDGTYTEPKNKSMVNDLSWVQDIKCMRVITEAEIDTELKILDDNFWNNFELPPNWDNKDFEV